MATVLDAVKIARGMLNDDDGLTWSDALMMPKVIQAQGEILAKFQINGLPIVKSKTAAIVVPAFAVSLGANLPTDIDFPIKMDEYMIGETQDNAVPMTSVEFVPNFEQETTLRYWCWINSTIQFLGSTLPHNVILYYIKNLMSLKKLSDILPIPQSEIYLGPRIAAIILQSQKDLAGAQAAQATAETNLSLVVRAQIKNQQNLPVRRKPFSYAIRRRQRMYI